MAVEVLVLDLRVLLLFTLFRPGVSARRFSVCIMRIEGHTIKSYKSESALMPDPYNRSYNTLSQVIMNQQYHTYRPTMSNESQHNCCVMAAPNTFNHEDFIYAMGKLFMFLLSYTGLGRFP